MEGKSFSPANPRERTGNESECVKSGRKFLQSFGATFVGDAGEKMQKASEIRRVKSFGEEYIGIERGCLFLVFRQDKLRNVCRTRFLKTLATAKLQPRKLPGSSRLPFRTEQ